MERGKCRRKSGFTMTEAIVALAIAGILLGLLVINVARISKLAYLRRANDSAEVVYMAMQSAVLDLKTQGKFDELFSDEFLGEPYNAGAAPNPKARFYTVPEAVLDGNAALNIPGATNSLGVELTPEELQELKDRKSLVYMVLKRESGMNSSDEGARFLRDLLEPYIADKSMLNYSILVELNRSNKTVRAAFYSEKTAELKYVQSSPDDSLKNDKSDVYFRERVLLDEKEQGYYGTLTVGERESVQKLDNAYAKIYNDDMLVVEWGEFTPQNVADWGAKKRVLPGMTYDLYLVNAIDTSKVYYKIEDITPYKEGEGYVTYIDGATNAIPLGNGEFAGNAQYGTTRMPIYDLFSWDDISHAMNMDLKVSSFKTFRYGSGSQEEISVGHRLSYHPGTESGGNAKPGRFRLILDNITEAGYDSLSISQVYPDLPWDENFKVIVEGKYNGEGFTGSLTLSQEVANAYTAGKGLYSQGEILTNSARGMNGLAEFVQYLKNRLAGVGADDNFWWYEIEYARHLNNIRYIIRDNAESRMDKQGKYQNFLMTNDIDWSLQKIGKTENRDGSYVHRLTVANTASEDLHNITAAELKIFSPLSTGEEIKDNGETGFSGLVRSDMDPHKPGVEPYSVSHLKLARNVADDAGNYNTKRITPDLLADYVGLFETISVDGEISHLTLSGLTLLGHNYAGGVAGTFYGKAEDLTVLKNEETREVKLARQNVLTGDWSEHIQGVFRPWDFAAGVWHNKSGSVTGNSHVGGLFGSVSKKNSANATGSGKLKNLANGTIYEDQHLAGARALNGIAVEAKDFYAGGIAGELESGVIINKVVNTGMVRADSYAGGIAGRVGKKVYLDGVDVEDEDEQFQVERRNESISNIAEYQNYGEVIANGGSYAGGIAGIADNGGAVFGRNDFPVLSNLRNAGFIIAEKTHAGGIAGITKTASLYNVQNVSDIHANEAYAGGIVGEAADKSCIEGAQNFPPEEHGSRYSTENGVQLYRSKQKTDVLAGISSERYVGGIAGALNDEAQINPLSFHSPVDPDKEHFVPTKADLAVYGTAELPLLIKRSEIMDLIKTHSASGSIEIMPLTNSAQVTGMGKDYSTINPLGTSFYVGGIAGAVTKDASLNHYSEDFVINWQKKIPMRNEGDITAIKGSYAGGIVGVATGKAKIYNAENGQNQDLVVQAVSYAGGIAGAVVSEDELGIGTNRQNKVVLANSEKLSWTDGSLTGLIESKEYYTNQAKLILAQDICAGGIVGYIKTEEPVLNFYNDSSVRAGRQAGGLFGTMSGDTRTEYEFATLLARMKRGTDEPYGTNAGEIQAGAMAGGIAGAVLHKGVQLLDVFNTGAVKTANTISDPDAGDYAGGIIGYVMVENPGVAGSAGIIRHSNDVIRDIIISSDGSGQQSVYTNTGTVYASGSYAGGIVGQGSVSLIDVFNAAEITAEDSYAGGIAGNLIYADTLPGEQITVSSGVYDSAWSTDVVGAMISHAQNGYGRNFSLYHNRGNVSTRTGAYAGGIAGAVSRDKNAGTDKIIVSDMYNAGHVVAGLITGWHAVEDTEAFKRVGTGVAVYGDDNISAGGIIGMVQGVTLEYSDISAAALIEQQSTISSEDKLVPNMGNVLAMNEAGGLIGSAKGTEDDFEDILIVNGMNRGVVRAVEESAGGLVGEGIWLTIRTNQDVAEEALRHISDPYMELFTNHGTIIAGQNNAGGIAGMLENAVVTDTFNRGEVHAVQNNAGGIVGYARNSTSSHIMEVSHTAYIAEQMFADTSDGGYTFSNTACVTAGANNAGGIAGKAVGSVGKDGMFFVDLEEDKKVGKIVFLDVYSGDPSTKDSSDTIRIEANNNAGGMVGRFVDAIIVNEHTTETALEAGIYTNNAQVTALDSNAGGIVGNADSREKSLLDAGMYDVRTYNTIPSKMKTEVDSNHFLIADVYNIGEITAKNGYNSGGIFGVAAAGAYNSDPELVKTAVKKGGMLTNKGIISANNNAGGVFGAVTAKLDTNELAAADNQNDIVRISGILIPKYGTKADVLDVFNGGIVTAKQNNAGGIAGAAVHLDLRYSKQTLEDTIKADDSLYADTFLAVNTGAIKTGKSNAGGIIGFGYQCIMQDVFNTGSDESLSVALNETEYRIEAGQDNAGGIIGRADGMKLFYSDKICDHIRRDRNYVYSNVANVEAGGSSAGGIAGFAENSIELLDAYNMGAIKAAHDNAGGLVGYLQQSVTTDRNGDLAAIAFPAADSDPFKAISIEDNTTIIRSDDRTMTADGKLLYRGEDFITFDKSVSYITYTTIVTGTEDQYKTGEQDSFGNDIYTNRYMSIAKPAVTEAHEDGYHIVAGESRAGGIVGYARSVRPNSVNADLMQPEDALVRIENVFSAGSAENPEIGGVWAKGNSRYKSNDAGGIIGRSEYTHLIYSFDINPGPDDLDVGGTSAPNSKGDHSVMTEAFNDPRVMKDPYAIKAVGLHMVANNTRVRASSYGPKTVHGNTGVNVSLSSGEFTNLASRNAGGAIGAMVGGRAERLYSLSGEVVTPTNLGGVVGYATDYALIRQTSRMGVYNKDKYDTLEAEGVYNIYSYTDKNTGELVKTDLDGVDIKAGTETVDPDTAVSVKTRGSLNVGGIVGYADNGSRILDTRNLVNVEGRAYVGGIIGQAGKNVEVTLAHNMQQVIGKVNSPEDAAHKEHLISVDQMTEAYLDRSAIDGNYIGGIVGKTYDTNGYGQNPTIVTMVKNDPLLTQNFEERLTEEYEKREKDIYGGNLVNAIDGRMYVGGITGAHGVVNYAMNTGQLTGVQYVGGISGKGYRITNSFNTADVDAENNYLYTGNAKPIFSQAVFVGGVAGQIGHRNNTKLQEVEPGSYIKNSYNASSKINGASIVGGIVGYAISPVDTTYNSASVTAIQSNLGNSGNETVETGNKVGGIVGQVAQDRAYEIKVIDSYNSGIVGGTGDMGGILGFVEFYADGGIINSTEQNGRKRIDNSYFIKDNSIRYYDILSAQVSSDINATLRSLNLDAQYPIEQFVDKTATASNLKGETVVDSDYGARNYSNMICNEYEEYRDLIVSTVTGGSMPGAGLTGIEDLQNPLNSGKILDWQTSNVTQPSRQNREQMGAAKFVFPYDDSTAGSTSESNISIMIGRDYEFLHLDFSGKDIGNKEGIGEIQLDPNTDELKNSNQWFVSKDNTRPSVLYNIWPTKVVDYMKVDVLYDDGGSAEDAVYDSSGHLVSEGSQKTYLAQQFYQLSNGRKLPKWQVNYNYTGTSGETDNHVPTGVFTPETLTLTGRFTDQNAMPRIMKFNIYDGYSRGDYSYDNAQFIVKRVENQIQKSYVMVREDEWTAATASDSNAIPPHREVDFRGNKYYFYVEANTKASDFQETDTVDIMELIDVSLQAVPTSAGGQPELEWKIVLPSIEMDTYLAAKSGFFTAEAVKIYDQADNIVRDDYKTWDRTSRMFNMHFSNYYSSKDPGNANYATRDYNHNRGIYDQYPNLDLDEFEAGTITRKYAVEDTAALGSVKLAVQTATDSNATASNANANETDDKPYIEKVTNRLQIANERHLYNLNKNQGQGTAQIDSYLPYVNRSIQLIRDVRLSTDEGYNCFIIGLSKGSFNRMTGSLEGRDLDGNIHTIGNLQVDMYNATRYLPQDIPEESYGLIYDLSGGVVKNLRIGFDSRIRAKRTGVLAYQASNGKSSTDVLNNPWYENLEPELEIEAGSDAKIYNTRVNADITGEEVGGYVYQTVRRFESSDETKSAAGRAATDVLTITNSLFGGKINMVKGNAAEDQYINNSLLSSGFLCRMQGEYDDNNLLESAAGGRYPQNAYVNGCEVTEDAYIYSKEYAAGIVGAVNNLSQAQVVVVKKSANNGAVVSTKRASGISQGIMEDAGNSLNKSGVDVWYSYNNGIVQTPDDTGLSSGIGNLIRKAAYATNNGSVIGRISSGISNYGAKNMEILQCANNGYVRGKQIAGGIVAAPARWDEAEGGALPYRSDGLSLNLRNCYNAGTVVVTTNVDNSRNGSKIDVIYNSYAGGIIGMAVLYDQNIDWFKTNDNYYLSSIEESDKRKTVVRNCYNVGQVYYEDGGRFSLNHRYVGGIAGGGLHRFVDIQNSYHLSDAEAEVGIRTNAYRADVNLTDYMSQVTPQTWRQTIAPASPDDRRYNYSLTAVGDMPYGKNVATLTFSDMLNLENFIGFNEEEQVWIIDHDTKDVNGYIYSFPQFAMAENLAGEMYVGDDYPADDTVPDAIFNVNINSEKFHVDVTELAKAIQIEEVTDKTLIPAVIKYQETVSTGELGPFDTVDATESNANQVEVIEASRYTIELSRNSSNYEVYVYDGDADASGYTPAMIRRYEVQGSTVTSGGKLHDEQSTLLYPMQYFSTAPGGPDYAVATGSGLTIGDKESVGWYMPIRGYYTVVVAERGNKADVSTADKYNSRIHGLSQNAVTRGGIKAKETANSSERFQIHFSGESIEARSGTYKSGSKAKPYEVTDQYSIIGMTTSGIAQQATDRRYYQQVSDIVIIEHVHPMFEFNGVYDAARQRNAILPGLMEDPIMDENYTISYRTDKGDFGFINYLAPTKEAREGGFIPTVSNLNILAEADGEYSNKLGRYLEAANYTTAIGIVADYAEYAQIDKVTTMGNVVYKNADETAYRNGYFGSGKAAFGGVAGIVKNTSVSRTKNNAALGGELTPNKDMIEGIEVTWTEHAVPAKGVQVAGITAVALTNGDINYQGKMEYVFNNGEIRATAHEDAAGIVHTVKGVDIRYTGNGGWIRAMNGTASGLVHTTDSILTEGYNSGLVTAGSVKGKAAGNAVGLFWNGNHNKIQRLYNAGVVWGNKQGAITQGTNISETVLRNVYYLKDEDLYWMDSSSLPDNMKIENEKQVELYLGFAHVPIEIYGFTEDEHAVKQAIASGTMGPYDSGDPFALTYAELTDVTTMVGKGFEFASSWKILNSSQIIGPGVDKTFIRDYRNDTYPLPQLQEYTHLTRRHLGFPVFLGGSKDIAKVPYEDGRQIVKYIPLDFEAGNRDENFKDTIAVDLNDLSTTARYHVVVYEGDPEMSEDSSGAVKFDAVPKLDITIQRRYVDTRDMTFETSTGTSDTITAAAIRNELNKEYGELFSNERGAYFYEVNALDNTGKERAAVFAVKEFLNGNKVELIFNNDILDELEEPGITGLAIRKPYYTVTIVETQVDLKDEKTDWNNFYSKFSPHFANAVAKQSDVWEYGTLTDKPYEIATQRNLYNIAKGTDTTAYLGNHYRQIQNIRLSAKKTDAEIANAAADSIKVSQHGTNAGSTVDKATVIKKQGDRKELWTEAVGEVKPGITENGFRGTYTGRKSPEIASDSNAVEGGYALVDTRTDIKSGIFGRVSPTAVISDVSYELAPVVKTSSSVLERPVNEVNVTKDVNALLVEENLGTVDNILFAGTEGGTSKTLRLSSEAELFALAVGATSQNSLDVPVPTVNRVSVEDGYQIKLDSASTRPLTVAGIVGIVSGEANIGKLESAAEIVQGPAGSTRHNKDIVGMLVGEIRANGVGGDKIVLEDLAMTGNLEITVPAANKTIGGLVGMVQGATVSITAAKAGREPLSGAPDTQMKLSSRTAGGTDAAVLGGIIGSVQGGSVILKNTESYLNIEADNADLSIIGGIIGSIDDAEDPAAPAAEVKIASASNASILVENTSRGNSVLGGVIGQVAGASKVGLDGVSTGSADAEESWYGITMKTPLSYTEAGASRVAGGMIGKVTGPDAIVEMADVINYLPILAEDNRGYAGYYLGGLIGHSEEGILYLHDTDPTEASNLRNEGRIFIENNNTRNNVIYAAGGIGYMKDSPATIFSFRNNGDVTVTADDARTSYHQSDVHIAGVLAYAAGELKGIDADVVAGTFVLSDALSVEENLNTGAILDERKLDFITGESVAGGIVAELEGRSGAEDTTHPVQVIYNHNAGDIRALRAAGILTEMSEDWKQAIEKTDAAKAIKTPVDLKYNININPIHAWYEEEASKQILTGSGITLVYELPLAMIEGREVDGYEIAAALATPSEAAPDVATPSVATPSVATPSVATPSVAYYNASLEDMVKLPDENPDPTAPLLPVDRISGAQLSLAEMQSLRMFLEATKWNSPEVIDDEAAIGVKPPKWIMSEGKGPGITENRYIPPGGISRLALAAQLIRVDRVPMTTMVRTWKLERIQKQTDFDDEDMEEDSEDIDLINDLEGEVNMATASNAWWPKATSSNASQSYATASNAQEEYQMVETVETVEADGFELSWKYSGLIPENDITATSSNAEPIEVPEYEFAIVWDIYGIRYSMQTGVLIPDGSDTWNFTVTPEMIAEMIEKLPYGDGILEANVSIAVIIDGRMYRGASETVYLEKESDTSTSLGTSADRSVLRWRTGEDLAGYPETVQYLVNYGLSRKGDPYSQTLAGYGSYVDCSYFVMDTYQQLGINLPRTAAAQAQYLEHSGLTVPSGDLEPGDLIYYSFEKNGRYKNISHVAMYIGNGMIVDASSSRGEVVSRGMIGLNSVVTCARPLAIN